MFKINVKLGPFGSGEVRVVLSGMGAILGEQCILVATVPACPVVSENCKSWIILPNPGSELSRDLTSRLIRRGLAERDSLEIVNSQQSAYVRTQAGSAVLPLWGGTRPGAWSGNSKRACLFTGYNSKLSLLYLTLHSH
jgi:hypothetical protein